MGFEELNLGHHHVCFERESEREKTLMHQLETRKAFFADGKALTEHAFDVALAVAYPTRELFGIISSRSREPQDPPRAYALGKQYTF